jgi:monothiol glutaredoxin
MLADAMTAPERPRLAPPSIAEPALAKMRAFHADALREVSEAIARHDVVVVGMAQNPHVRHVRRALEQANIAFEYLEYGSYLSAWRTRLAIKMWSGWPTFPQVFVKGVLLGGADLTRAAIADGSLQARLVSAER